MGLSFFFSKHQVDRPQHSTDSQQDHKSELLSFTAPQLKTHLLAFSLSLTYVVYLIATSTRIGIPRDESIYFYAADRFIDWFVQIPKLGWSVFSEQAIYDGFKVNHEHPMLMKMLFGLSHHYLHVKWSLISDPILAYRLPTMLLGGATVYLTSLLGSCLGGLWLGLSSALFLIGMPRLFFHAHLACFDLPVTAMWLFIALAYFWAWFDRKWIFGSGLVLGLGLATKLNAFFAPFSLLLLSLYHLAQVKDKQKRAQLLKHYITIALSMIILGLTVFWLHWPWLYDQTWSRLIEYISFHARHVHYPVDYLGTLYHGPPFPIHFPFVFTLFTIPVAVLILGIIGVFKLIRLSWQRWQKRNTSLPIELFILINLMAPILIIALPSTPIFGGTKHWMPSMPFLAITAAWALLNIMEHINLVKSKMITGLTIIALVAPGLWLTHEYGAHGPAWYNSIAGGAPGAAEMRMPRNFWGYSSIEVLPWLNQRDKASKAVFWHNATGLAVHHYKKAHWLDRHVQSTGDWTYPYADWALYHHQQEKLPEEVDLWWRYGTPLPVEGFFIESVQQIGVYGSVQAREQLEQP